MRERLREIVERECDSERDSEIDGECDSEFERLWRAIALVCVCEKVRGRATMDSKSVRVWRAKVSGSGREEVGSGTVSERSEEATPLSHGSPPRAMGPIGANSTVEIPPSFDGW